MCMKLPSERNGVLHDQFHQFFFISMSGEGVIIEIKVSDHALTSMFTYERPVEILSIYFHRFVQHDGQWPRKS